MKTDRHALFTAATGHLTRAVHALERLTTAWPWPANLELAIRAAAEQTEIARQRTRNAHQTYRARPF